MEKLKIIVSGFIGLYPSGGVTWDYIQYPLGFHLLGHDVYYFEDTHQYPVYQVEKGKWDDCSASVEYLKSVMQFFGLPANWAYRDAVSGRWYGMPENKIKEVFKTADIFINVSSATHIKHSEYAHIPKKVLIDSDPMFTQVQYWDSKNKETSETQIRELLNWYDFHFSFGENIGQADCKIPTYGFTWKPTRQPICLEEWRNKSAVKNEYGFSTVMNWSARNPMEYANEFWGQKDIEFKKFKELPSITTKVPFNIIVSCAVHAREDFEKHDFKSYGWNVLSPDPVISTPAKYRQFIQSSFGEFSVAKETYVKSNSGWFSCRSACYLAAGRPVIAQDTQWSKYIPHGEGLLAFSDMNSAMTSLQSVLQHTKIHERAAKEIAFEYFDSHKILTKLLQEII